MNEMMNYIFASIGSSEKAIKSISKALCRQTQINKRMSLFMMATATYMILAELDRREQKQMIRKLSKEIEELKGSEGE